MARFFSPDPGIPDSKNALKNPGKKKTYNKLMRQPSCIP